jgi:hypothetical protein
MRHVSRSASVPLRAGKPHPHVNRILGPMQISDRCESRVRATDPRATFPVPKLDRAVRKLANADAIGRIVAKRHAVAVDQHLSYTELVEPLAKSFNRRFAHN